MPMPNVKQPADIPVVRAPSRSVKNSPRVTLSALPVKESSQNPEFSSSQLLPMSATENAVLRVCEACELPHPVIWNCSYCDMDFCETCWSRQGPHKAGRTGPDGLPHEQADPDIVKRLRSILSPPSDPFEQQYLHVEDEDTTWFGVARDSSGQPIFQDYGRYAAIMADSNTGEHQLRFPELVSFIGQTGAGKSTIVKMLIDQQERKLPKHKSFSSPVVGSVKSEHVPTSGDVHLYADPRTYYEEYPMLYADCEGLEGGETLPMSVQHREASVSSKEKSDGQPETEHRRRLKRNRITQGTQHNIRWADSPEKSKRQYAVTELYPRLLYTFSDVIVFVLRNPKTFASAVVSKLVNWASSSMEKSLNQPTLPHAVIVLNATDVEINEEEWDPEFATKALLSSVAEAAHRDPSYQRLLDVWARRGKVIHTMKDLLECYYSSVTVVRIPIKGRYMKIDDQVRKLRNLLQKRCIESSRAKRKSRMLSNSEELNMYLQCAFDHFSQDLDTPFNFMDVAFRINPIPLDFGGNILKLAVAIKESQYSKPENIFRELSFMVASCILLDCSRHNLKGPAEKILEKAYMHYCNSALEDFCAIFSPCTFSSKRGRCVNVKERHAKGHQNARGQIIGTGPYESDFTWESFAGEWARLLQTHLSDLQNKVQTVMTVTLDNELNAITDFHSHNVNRFFQRLGGASNFVSHSTCFCCLRDLAEHPLPCGHILCSACIKHYGRQHAKVAELFTINSCPLHELDTKFPTPWEIQFKPPSAGVRILSLDGGGIRGIVILEVLRAIEIELGKKIPIQNFFDLIVGTSTGGLLALGLGIKDWSVDHIIEIFPKLIDKAFTPKLSGLKFGRRKYRTRPLEEVLVEHFKDEPLFGGFHEAIARPSPRVAVTAATETGDQAVIFTNYNRADADQIGYRLIRPDDPKDELKIWEAARATSAAPTFFRPFVNPCTKEGFLDGAVFHNNPVRIANYESKLIWPDVEDFHPDILLSVGTGHNGIDTEGFINVAPLDRRRLHERKVLSKTKPVNEKQRPMPALRAFPEVHSWLNILFKRVDNILDSEAIWRNFRKDIIGISSSHVAQRYIRINPRIRFQTPKMDEKSQVGKLQSDVRSRMQSQSMREKVSVITARLVASSFYFEQSGPAKEYGDHYIVQGTLKCRFMAGSDYLRALGEYMRKRQLQTFQPFFRIREANNEEFLDVRFTPTAIQNMIEFGNVEFDRVRIPITMQRALVSIDLHLSSDPNKPHPFSGFSISGFPRPLSDDDALRRASLFLPSSPSTTTSHSSEEHSKPTLWPSLGQQTNAHNFFSSDTAHKSRNSDEHELPHSSQKIMDWIHRRQQAIRAAPVPVQNYIGQLTFELDDASWSIYNAYDESDDELARALESCTVPVPISAI